MAKKRQKAASSDTVQGLDETHGTAGGDTAEQSGQTQSARMPLELRWLPAGQLDENPENYKSHPNSQLKTLDALITDPEIGWAGALLYNRRTKRLIDGHGRKQRSQPDELVPVLCGEWSEEAERKILMTLDPVAAMAEGNAQQFAALAKEVEVDDLFLRDLIDNTQRDLDQQQLDDDEEGEETLPKSLKGMEAQPLEHHDYLVLMFDKRDDFELACGVLGIERVEVSAPGEKQRIGLGRVIKGAKAIQTLAAAGKGGA